MVITISDGEQKIDEAHIRQRLRDWRDRLSRLYSDIETWLPQNLGYEINLDDSTILNQELMQKFDVGPVELPVLKIVRDGQSVLTFMPKGLWVIGANGRVDVFGISENWVLVDMSEQFETESDWQLADFATRSKQRPFDAQLLGEMLGG